MIAKIRRYLERKRHAYRMVFMQGGDLSPLAQIVLTDLRKFCKADESCVVVSPVSRQIDTHATLLAEGRREVWLRIISNLNLSDDIISKLVDRELAQERDNED